LAANRRRGEVGDQLIRTLHFIVLSLFIATLEEPAQTGVDARQRPLDIGEFGWRELVELNGTESRITCIDTVDEERVEVRIHVERATRSLHDIDSSGAEAQDTRRKTLGASSTGGAREDRANEDPPNLCE
jgi:hypothetical protein